MNERVFDADAVMNALLPLLGLAAGPDSRPQVKIHLEIAAGHAARLLEFPLDDDEEPAPVFTP